MKKIFMKSSFILPLFVLLFFANSASAQFIIGGSLGWSTSSSTGMSGKTDAYSSSFSIAPCGIFMFGEKMGVGLSLGFDNKTVKSRYDWTDLTVDVRSYSNFTIAPSFRYIFAKFDKVSLYADAIVPISTGGYDDYENNLDNGTAADLTKSHHTTSGFGIVVQPGIGYSLTEKVTLFASVFHMNLYSTQSDTYTRVQGATTITTTLNSTNSEGFINLVDPHFMIGFNVAL